MSALPISGLDAIARVRARFARRRAAMRLVDAGLVLAVLAAIAAGPLYLDRVHSPEQALAGYVAAEAQTDGATALSLAAVAGEAAPGEVSLLGPDAFTAMLKTAPRISDLGSVQAAGDGDQRRLTATYAYGGRPQTATFTLVRDPGVGPFALGPAWRVLIHPAHLTVNLPTGAGAVSIDGMALGSKGSPLRLAVLPGRHLIRVGGSRLYQPAELWVDAAEGGVQSAVLRPPLTGAGRESAGRAISAAFRQCALSTEASPSGCPQTLPSATGRVDWQLVGLDLPHSWGISDQGAVTGSGRYQMIAIQLASDGQGYRTAVTGGYLAALHASGEDFTVDPITATEGLQPVPREPAATDDVIRSAVAAVFQDCAGARYLWPANCPQQWNEVEPVSAVAWSLVGDPLQGASVSYQADQSRFLVTGRFAMKVAYDARYPLFGVEHLEGTDSAGYSALVLWNGSKPIVVSIERR